MVQNIVQSEVQRLYWTIVNSSTIVLQSKKDIYIYVDFPELPEFPVFRPIISSLGTFNYHLVSHLGDMLKDIIPKEYSCADTFAFIEDLKGCEIEDKFTISFDICSLFSNIPLHETLNLAVDLIFENYPEIKISKMEMLELFRFCTSKTNFLFDGVVYDQIDGIAMGSPLAPTLANLFMGHHEKFG